MFFFDTILDMSKVRIGVLRGGPSSEYDVSLNSGKAVLEHLAPEKYAVQDILIDKDGCWHMRGIPREIADVLNHMDVAFLALHGEYGEDGKVQRLLDRFGVPYTGSKAMPSTLSMNKAHTKKQVEELGFLVPKGRVLEVSDHLHADIMDILRSFSFPLIVKPNSTGSSVGVTLAFNQDELTEGIRKAFEFGPRVLVEQYIDGREATCGVIEDFRGDPIYSLLPVEIVPDHTHKLFDYTAKYSGNSKELCPGNFSRSESDMLQNMARTIHQHLGLRHYSRSDFMVTPKGIYYLETNTLPGLTNESLLPKSIEAVGSNLGEFFDHIIGLAQRR